MNTLKKPFIALLSMFMLFGAVSLSAADKAEETAAPVDKADQLLNDFFNNTKSLKANFSQITLDDKGQQIEPQASTGVFVLERPGKFRWQVEEPSVLLLIADGKNFWNYDVELEQVIVKPINQSLSNTPAMLLSGEADLLDAFDLGSRFATTTDVGEVQWLQLNPKDKNADFSRLSLGFIKNQIRLMELATNVGQVIRIEFTEVSINPELTDQLFKFSAPDYVDIIGTPAK